jgi:hypothetical protein
LHLAVQPLLLLATIVVAGAGCDVVRTAAPVGDRPVVLDPQEWNGVWAAPADLPACLASLDAAAGHGDDVCLVVSVADAQVGVLAITSPDEDHAVRAYVRSAQGSSGQSATFLSLEGEGDLQGMWMRLRKSDNLIVTWDPDAAPFRELVRAGLLPGSERPEEGSDARGELEIDRLDAGALALVVDDHGRTLFDWINPGVFVRVRAW